MAAKAPPYKAIDAMYKILLIGDSNVGKTCMLLRLVDNRFSTSFITTIGIDFKIRTFTLSNTKLVRLQIWDTAGQEKFKSITTAYFRGADAIVVVYDPTDLDSFDSVVTWMKTIHMVRGVFLRLKLNELFSGKCKVMSAKEGVQKFLVATKADLEPRWKVSQAEGRVLAARYKMPFFATSAKTGFNIVETFQEMAEILYEEEAARDARDSGYVRPSSEHPDPAKPCCSL